MICIKLLSEPEYEDAKYQGYRTSEPKYEKVLQGKEYREYHKNDFYHLLRKKREFADEESCALLRYMHGEVAVREKLYRYVTPEGKACMPAISEETMYGLVLIENSRRGIYTSYEHEYNRYYHFWDAEPSPKVWDILDELGMDILLMFRKKDLRWFSDRIPLQRPFIVENYPINGILQEVYVYTNWGDIFGEQYGLTWISNEFSGVRYQWQEDIGGILEAIDSALDNRVPNFAGVLTRWFKREEIDPEEFDLTLGYGRIPCLVVEEYHDGSYCLYTELEPDYGAWDESINYWMVYCLACNLGRRKGDANLLILPLAVDEWMSCAQDIENAGCVFRVSGDDVLMAEKTQGLYELRKILKKIQEGDFRFERIEENHEWKMRVIPK